MGLFDGVNNPWAPGGQMSPQMPWSQPGLDYGWGHGNEFFTPKTKEQIHKEAMLQLAVLAAVVVAPAVLGAAGGGGAGASMASGAGSVGGGLGSGASVGSSVGVGGGSVGAGLAGTTGGGGMMVESGAQLVAPLVDSTLAAGAGTAGAAGAGGVAASGASVLGAFGAIGLATALQPFLQADSLQSLQRAAQMGEAELDRELKRRSGDCDCPPAPRFRTEEWQRQQAGCGCGEGSKQVREKKGIQATQRILEQLADLISMDVRLQNELKNSTRCCKSGLSEASKLKVFKQIGESVPMGYGVKALEDLANPMPMPERPRLSAPVGIRANPQTNTITGTIYIEFDSDFWFGNNPSLTMNNIADAAAAIVNQTLQANTFGGRPIISNIAVIPVPQSNRPPANAHVFKIGNGASDNQWSNLERRPNPRMSWATKGGKNGYLYNAVDAGHEVMHWLGLSDRYTEAVFVQAPVSTGRNPPRAIWCRYQDVDAPNSPRVLPLANVQPILEPSDYFPLSNVMSSRGLTLTQYQLQIVFSNGRNIEEEYDRDVIALGPRWEREDNLELAVEFDGHDAFWWNVDADRRKFPNEFYAEPSTFRKVGFQYFGQNFNAVRYVLHDRDGSQDSDNIGPRVMNNRRDVDNAIRHNR